MSTKKPVVDENYNEIVFIEPSNELLQMLNSKRRNPQGYAAKTASTEPMNVETDVKALKVVDRLNMYKGFDDEDFK